ncbi:MarR family winged helix-turn-helix transcriptional regulator [Streptomyces avicenniae]|uniref:MarR family winged helix-turn-helix transcriptional regulator n=1 Tax=Streptomyces avicenniae TaxID=500153 RepID=UPI00069B0EA0|nr:MarR family winged helix-turn-helix transcriptional regulator [Streptomyces avicenniae]
MDFPRETVHALERLLRLFRRMSTPSDLSLTAVATLSTLERTGPRRLTELAAAEGVTQPAMTQLVSRLQDAGLAARAADPADGRVVLVGITDTGRDFLERRRALRAERLVVLLDRLPTDQQDALRAALPAIDALTRLALEEPPAVPTAAVPDTRHTPGAPT